MSVNGISPDVVRLKALKSLERLPTISLTIGRVLVRLTRPDCEVRELADLIQRDPALSAQVLHVANSGLYGRLRRISSVTHGISLIGLNTVRRYVLVYSVARMFGRLRPGKTFALQAFNAHSAGTALLADLLARELPVRDREYAFASGLLHDLGRLLIAVGLPGQYDSVMGVAAISRRSTLECETEILGLTHVDISCAALESWGMPEAMVNAVFHHHSPESDQSARPGAVTLSTVVAHADSWLNAIGVTPCLLASTPQPDCLEFPGREYPRQAVLKAFEAEMASLVAVIGYQGTWAHNATQSGANGNAPALHA